MDKTWLVRLFADVGLEAEQAERAAEETRVRLLRRERPRFAAVVAQRRSLTEFLVRDPLVSLNRIIGRGDAGLPFFDDDMGQLSLIAFAHMLTDIGLDAVVSMAYAKVVVEAYEPADLYGPIWAELGKSGPVDLEELRRMDWSPLRTDDPTVLVSARDTIITAVHNATETAVSVAATHPANRQGTLTTPAARRSAPQRPTKAKPSATPNKPKK